MLYFSTLTALLCLPSAMRLRRSMSIFWAMICAVAMIFLFGGKNYNGWDWVIYEPHYECVKYVGSIAAAIAGCARFGAFEPGYILIEWLVSLTDAPVSLLYFSLALISAVSIYQLLKKRTDDPAIAFAVYLCIFGWSLHMQILRQGIAVVIGLWAITNYAAGGSRLKFILFVLCACMFHLSAAMLLAVPAILKMKFTLLRVLSATIALSILGLLSSYFLVDAGNSVGNLVGMGDKFSNYGPESANNASAATLGAWLRWVAQAPLAFYAWRVARLKDLPNPKALMIQRICKVYLFGFMLYPACTAQIPFLRAVTYYQALFPFVCSYAVSGALKMWKPRLYVLFVPLLLLLSVLRDPYASTDYLPYNNLFLDYLSGVTRTYGEEYRNLRMKVCATNPDSCF